MNAKLNKIFYTGLIAFLTLGVLLGGNYLYNQFFVNQPLSSALENSKLIKSHQLTQKGKFPHLKLELAVVSDFPQEFAKFLNNSGDLLLDKPVYLELQSKPNENIHDFYQEIHPVIYETLTLGNFSTLQEKLRLAAKEAELSKAKLTVNQNHLYLQLEDKDSYLYLVFNRTSEFPVIVNELGSDAL